MTEAHVMAIADTPVPPDLLQETTAAAKPKAKGETSFQTTTKTERYSKLKIYILNIINTSS